MDWNINHYVDTACSSSTTTGVKTVHSHCHKSHQPAVRQFVFSHLGKKAGVHVSGC
jgi:hypothetical protein